MIWGVKVCNENQIMHRIQGSDIHGRQLLQDDRFAGGFLEIHTVNHFGELLILLRKILLREEQ